MKNIVLLLTQAHLAALTWSERGAMPFRYFSHDEEGRSEFAEFVERYASSRFYLLTDLVEEDFQRESSPHLSSRDQAQLLRRKLDQLFRATPYRRAVVQSRGRRGQQVQLQLSAIINRELVDTVVDVLLAARVDLQGVYSVALLTQDLIAKLKLDIPHLLLMSCSSPGTLRQSYFTPTGLQFSRLGAFDPKQGMVEQGHAIAAEIRRARQYLGTLRLMGREDQLQVISFFDVSIAGQLPAVADELKADGEQIQVLQESGLPMLVQKLKLPSCCSTWHDVLVASLLKLKVRNHYAPPDLLRYARLYQLGRGMQISAFIFIALGVILSGFTLLESEQIQEQLHLNHAQQQREQTRLREINQKLKSANTEQPAQIQAAVQLYQREIQDWPSPEKAAQQFSQIFVAFPRLVLEKFDWQVGGMLPISPEGQPASAESILPRGAQQWTISGRAIDPKAYRQALTDVNRLADELRKLPNATVQVLKHPLDIRPEVAVNSTTTDLHEKTRIDFIIQVTVAPTKSQGGTQ